MRKINKLRGMVALWACLGVGSFVSAAPITTLFNTGVSANDSNGNPTGVLADGATDTHWTLQSTPDTSTAAAPFVVNQNGNTYPIDGTVWVLDNSLSKWISLHANESTPADTLYETPGSYTYTTTFNLTGFIPSTASITGKYWEDDFVTDILINTTDTGLSQNGGNTNGAGQSFSITSGFIPGVNTLTFIVYNYPTNIRPNPTGLNVEMTGTATTLPEPASLGFLAAGGVLAMRRRNRRATK